MRAPEVAAPLKRKVVTFDAGWTFQILSPYSGDNTIAYCDLLTIVTPPLTLPSAVFPGVHEVGSSNCALWSPPASSEGPSPI